MNEKKLLVRNINSSASNSVKFKNKNSISLFPSFQTNYSLPLIKETKNNSVGKDWKFLKNYKNSISNLNLNINLYYKFSNKIPKSYNWFYINNNKELIPSFTKKIFNQVLTLF